MKIIERDYLKELIDVIGTPEQVYDIENWLAEYIIKKNSRLIRC